jgi:hypothetical protein
LSVEAGSDGEMAPRYPLAASPYAMRAKTANGLEGREARFLELALNGFNHVGFRAPDNIGADLLWTLPATDGTSGQVLATNGSGLLSWSTAGSGTVTSVTAGTGLSGGPVTTSGSLSFDTAFGDGRYVTLSLDQTIAGAKTFTNPANSFAGSGAGLTGVNADFLDGLHVADLDLRYIRVAGGTMSGTLTLAGDPVIPLEAATKRYVDTGLAGKANVSPNADLSNLVVSGLLLSPAFSPATGFYIAECFIRPVTVTVTPTASDPAATLAVNGMPVASGATSAPIGVRSGITQISIVVTAADGATRKGYMVLIYPRDIQQYVKASNTGAGDWFGSSVAVSGDTVVVGAPLEASNATGVNGNQADNSATNSGAAYVFVRSGTVWTQQAYLKALNTAASDFFGYSIAVSADTVVVGATMEDSSATGVNGNPFDNSVPDSGAAYVFVRSGGAWTQQAYLKASSPGIIVYFGWSVAVSSGTVVVGANWEDSSATGVNGNPYDNSATDSGACNIFE